MGINEYAYPDSHDDQYPHCNVNTDFRAYLHGNEYARSQPGSGTDTQCYRHGRHDRYAYVVADPCTDEYTCSRSRTGDNTCQYPNSYFHRCCSPRVDCYRYSGTDRSSEIGA